MTGLFAESQSEKDHAGETAAAAGDILYARMRSLRWSKGFEGPYAECFCALISTLDRNRTLREAVEAMPHYDETFSLIDFLNAMAALGLHAERRPLGSLTSIEAPALIVPKDSAGAPIAVLSTEKLESGERIAKVYDGGSRGVRSGALDKDGRPLRGVLYIFKRRKIERAENLALLRAGAGYGWFRSLAIRFYRIFAQVLCLSFFINLLGLATPLFIMLVYDRVIAARATEALPYLIAGVAIAIIFDWMFRSMRSHRLAWIAARVDNIVGHLTFDRLTKLPAQASDNISVTAQLLRLRSFESVRDFFSSAASLSVLELPFVAVYITAIAILGGWLAAIPIVCIGAYLLLFTLMRKRIGVEIRRTARSGAASQRFLLETFSKRIDILVAGLAEKWIAKYNSLSKREFDAFARLISAGNVSEALAHGVTQIGGAATLAVGALMIFSGDLSAGALIACLIMTWKTLTPFHNFCAVIQRIEQIRNSILQIDSLMEMADEEEERSGGAVLRSLRGGVVFERVGLRLDERRSPVFLDLSFTAAPGEVIGFTGESGSGKSLILKLIQGVYRPTFGAVRIDGFDLRQLDASSLRRMISYIPQQPQLFSGSIEENVRLVRPDADAGQVWRALEKAGIAEEVKSFPDGVQTQVMKDRRLSADLLTRISMARAYLQDGDLFLIDELPNALLYGEAGLHLKFFIRENAGRRTILLVSQNPYFLNLCDRVYEITTHGLRALIPGGRNAPERAETMEQVA